MATYAGISAFVREHGAKATASCIICKLWLKLLTKLFRLRPWVQRAPYACRPYKAEAVRLANSVGPDLVVDIGCGIGDIVSKVRAKRRFGFDRDKASIKAAKWLYRQTTFGDAALSDAEIVAEKVAAPIDLLIMVNWTHGISFEDMAAGIAKLKQLIPVKYFLIDSINSDWKNSHRHTRDQLSQLGEIHTSMASKEDVRTWYLVRLS